MSLGPWLDVAHAAEYAGYPDALSADAKTRRKATKAFLMWVERKGVPCGHRGRRPVFKAVDIDRAYGGTHLNEVRTQRKTAAA